MAAYTHGCYVYFKNMTDLTSKHHNHFILNKIQSMYIASPLKFMDKYFNRDQTYLLKKS